MTADWCVFKFFRGSVDGKFLMRFQSEIFDRFQISSALYGPGLSFNHLTRLPLVNTPLGFGCNIFALIK